MKLFGDPIRARHLRRRHEANSKFRAADLQQVGEQRLDDAAEHTQINGMRPLAVGDGDVNSLKR